MIRLTFLALVRSGLWNTPADPALFNGMSAADWEEVYHFARTQALLAITFDGMLSLPSEARPPRPLYLQWAAQVARIEQSNIRLNAELPEIFMPYREAGLHPVLLKGQGIATYYINPLHRQCGDIDVYIGKEGQPIANSILLRHGAAAEGEASDKHASYSLHNIHIENHRMILRINNPAGNRYFQRLVKEWHPQQSEMQEINEYPVALPPVTFNVLYIFMHAFVHFLNSGIGLRQVCDWARLLAMRQDDIDKVILERHFRKVGLLRAAKAFGYIAVHHLGLPEQDLPFSIKGMERAGEVLLDDIFATGNFGQYDTRVQPRPKGYWSGKWHTFCRATKRCMKLRQFAPGEAMWYPVTLIKGTITIQLNKLRATKRQATSAMQHDSVSHL